MTSNINKLTPSPFQEAATVVPTSYQSLVSVERFSLFLRGTPTPYEQNLATGTPGAYEAVVPWPTQPPINLRTVSDAAPLQQAGTPHTITPTAEGGVKRQFRWLRSTKQNHAKVLQSKARYT